MRRNVYRRPYYWFVSINYLILHKITVRCSSLLRQGTANLEKKAVWAIQKSTGAAYLAESERIEELVRAQQEDEHHDD